MIQCSLCKNGFPLLEEGTTCGKCLARKPGRSATELEAINVSYQTFRLAQTDHFAGGSPVWRMWFDFTKA